jgi:hypothetical protein
MNGRTIAAVLLVLFLTVGGIFLGVSAYNAGVTAGLAQNLAEGGSDVVVTPGYATAPYVGWGYGWGHPGFGFFGFLFFLFFLFLIFGLIRATFGWGRGWGRGGWGPGGWGPGGPGRYDYRGGSEAWNDRVREVHDELHRSGGAGGPGGQGSQSPSGDAAPRR